MTLLEAQYGLTLLVVGTVFASFLIPASVLLFHFSPVAIWRSPLFILNVLAIIMGLAEQTIYVYVIVSPRRVARAGPPRAPDSDASRR